MSGRDLAKYAAAVIFLSAAGFLTANFVRRRRGPVDRAAPLAASVPAAAAPATQLPSLELLAKEVQAEREAQARHADGLDAKAGLILGFAGVLVALGSVNNVIALVGRIVAAVAAGLALYSYYPQPFPILNVGVLREYLTRPSLDTAEVLLDTKVRIVQLTAERLEHKARWIGRGFGLLVLAVALILSGIVSSSFAKEQTCRLDLTLSPPSLTAAPTAQTTVKLHPTVQTTGSSLGSTGLSTPTSSQIRLTGTCR